MKTKMRFLTLNKSLSMGLILAIFYMVICCGFVDASSSTSNSRRNNNQSRILQYRTSNPNSNPKTVHRLSGDSQLNKVNKSDQSIACDLKCLTKLKKRKTIMKIPTAASTTIKPMEITTTAHSLVNTSNSETIDRTNTSLDNIHKNNNNNDKTKTSSFSDSDLTQKIPNLKELFNKVRDSRKQCKLKQKKNKSFHCQRLQWAWWIVRELEKKNTKLNDFVELIHRNDSDVFNLDDSQLLPESRLEKRIYNLVLKYGEPMDQLVFLEAKKYAKSRELKVTIPSIAEIKIGPKTHTSLETGRIFFDPGFNFKMKIPFFRDEMKFAVSTGPSFIAGLGLGMVMLGIKSMFSPMMFAMKAMMWSYFMKDTSPLDLLKWTFGMGGSSNDEHVEEVQHVETYNPPHVHNPYDNVLDKHAFGASGTTGSNNNYNTFDSTSYGHNLNHNDQQQYHSVGGGYDLGQNSNNQQNQYGLNPNRINPILPQLMQSISSGVTGSSGYNQIGPTGIINLLRGRNRPITTGTSGSSSSSFTSGSNLDNYRQTTEAPETGFKYVPSAALQLEVENFDPFYSPLLSRIDSIFMHLGFTEEGCKERAVCSIYKFPVKYAPYSNLLSAQLSKHQSELKRPVSTSPKILRYFKYMKAAKDGQGALNCLELYPKCNNDTEKLSSLPMVKTYQTLTELMGTGSG